MKFQRWLFTFLVCMISFAVFSYTSEPKQKLETTSINDSVKIESFSIVKNVKQFTFDNVFKVSDKITSFNFKESVNTTIKYIFDVGWRSKENYNYTLKIIPENYVNNITCRIRNDC